jgi:hypothetical protein
VSVSVSMFLYNTGSRGLIMPREELNKMSKKELDKTSKEGTVETLDEDET